jgi:transposase-like protein
VYVAAFLLCIMKVKKCSIIKHRKQFGTTDQCLSHLCAIKWKDGYTCKQCNHDKYVKGRVKFDRRCQNCKFNESPTSGTMFHSTKLNLVLYFEIIFRIVVNKKGLSSVSIAREYGLNLKTANRIHHKLQIALQPDKEDILKGEIHVDEFFFGGKEQGKQGRSASTDKYRASIAVQILPGNKIGKVQCMHIENFSSKEIKRIFDKHIEPDSLIIADKWRGYAPLVKDYPNLYQIDSKNGESMPELHTVILLIKKFLKGIHHTVSLGKFQHYLNEFVYRFNRRNFVPTINISGINRMVLAGKHPKANNGNLMKSAA